MRRYLLVSLWAGVAASASASSPPLSEQQAVAAYQAAYNNLPSEGCQASEDGFDTFLEYFVRNPKLAARYTAANVSQPLYLQLQDNIWIYARANSSDTLDAPGASLKYEFKKGPPVRVGLSVQQGQYDRQYNMEQTYGPVHSYEFTHANGCWTRTK